MKILTRLLIRIEKSKDSFYQFFDNYDLNFFILHKKKQRSEFNERNNKMV